jgi:hypothetical protein
MAQKWEQTKIILKQNNLLLLLNGKMIIIT